MIVIVDERTEVVQSFASMFGKEGVVATGVSPAEFDNWVRTASSADLDAVDAVLLGSAEGRASITKGVKKRLRTALIALNDQKSLDETLDLPPALRHVT